MQLKIHGAVTVSRWISCHTFFAWKEFRVMRLYALASLPQEVGSKQKSPSAPISELPAISSATLTSAPLVCSVYAQSCVAGHTTSALLATWRTNSSVCLLLLPLLPVPPFLKYFCGGEKWFDYCFYSIPRPAPFSETCLARVRPQCFGEAAVLRWLCQQLLQQQVITMTYSGNHFLAKGLVLSADDICHGQDICDIRGSVCHT